MKLFFKYVYQYRYSAVVLMIFTLIFGAVFFLYDVKAEAVIYADLICSVIALVMISLNFIKFRRRHLLMQDIHANLPLMTDKIPSSENLTQDDLQKIIDRLAQINNENITHYNSKRRESIDYYTLWIHQIKTPIAAMQMILQSEDTETNRELSAELFRIEQYAEMVLNYLRLDSSSSDFIIKEYELDSIIKQAIHRYAPLFIRQKIKLIYSDTNAKVLTDEKWLVFIIEQILSNAVKYTSKGSVTITFTENKILKITDTGMGIVAEDIPRIFEKGFTGFGGRANKKSTGLGLYLCKKAADKLFHKLSVESQIGIGTTFSIDLSSANIKIE
ncbi:MAG: sensor histidine kinase [Ruminococcus sp.]|nr:sensor histidine kinase [Ruminococcus sp.]